MLPRGALLRSKLALIPAILTKKKKLNGLPNLLCVQSRSMIPMAYHSKEKLFKVLRWSMVINKANIICKDLMILSLLENTARKPKKKKKKGPGD